MNRTPDGAALRSIYSVVLGRLATRGRLAALGALGGVLIIAGFTVGRAAGTTGPDHDGATLLANLGLGIVLPVSSLVMASSALGELREDHSLVYLWLRPLRPWVVPLAGFGAAVSLVLPLVLLPGFLAALLSGTGRGLPGAALIAMTVGTLAYCGVFLAFGLWVRRTLLWGLAYILIWEGFVASAGTGPASLAIRAYTRSIIARVTDTELGLGTMSLTTGILVPLAITLGAMALAVHRYGNLDVD